MSRPAAATAAPGAREARASATAIRRVGSPRRQGYAEWRRAKRMAERRSSRPHDVHRPVPAVRSGLYLGVDALLRPCLPRLNVGAKDEQREAIEQSRDPA